MRFDGTEPELCLRCGFDSRRWRRQDASVVFHHVGRWWRHATMNLGVDVLNERPAPGVWSALEYGLHSAMVLPILRYAVEVMVTEDRVRVHDPCPELDIEDASHPLRLDPQPVLDALEREGGALGRFADSCDDGWGHLGEMDDASWWQAEATLLHAVHDTTHHFLDVAEGLSRLGVAPQREGGVVSSMTVAGDGVPELLLDPIVEAAHQPAKQALPPYQAVRVFPDTSDHPDRRSDGPGPGLAIASSALDWSLFRPGTRLLAGTVLLELSYPVQWFRPATAPAREIEGLQQADWFAWVRAAGHLRPGDTVVISPA